MRRDFMGGGNQKPPERDESTDAGHMGGPTRCNVEVSLIGMERRGWIIRHHFLVDQ